MRYLIKIIMLCTVIIFIGNDLFSEPYWDQFKRIKKRSFYSLRVGLGGWRMINTWEEEMSREFERNGAVLVDFNVYRIEFLKYFRFDPYVRTTFKYIHVEDFEIFISEADIGARCSFVFNLFNKEMLLYILIAPRFVYYGMFNEKDNENNFTFGAIGGAGFEFQIVHGIGMFLEFNLGYAEIEGDLNLEGPQGFVGVAFYL